MNSEDSLKLYKIEYEYMVDGEQQWRRDIKNIVAGADAMAAVITLQKSVERAKLQVQNEAAGANEGTEQSVEVSVQKFRLVSVNEIAAVHECVIQCLIDHEIITTGEGDEPDSNGQ